jgi:hypothetical protein
MSMSERKRGGRSDEAPGITDKSPGGTKVIFSATYIGSLGIFYKGGVYELSRELYGQLKKECKEVT